MPDHAHRLDAHADAAFLAEGHADPFTRVAFRPGNVVVRSADGEVLLAETWHALGGSRPTVPWAHGPSRAALRTPPNGRAALPPEPPARPAWLGPLLAVAGLALLVGALVLAGVFSRDEAPPPEPLVESGPEGPRPVAATVGVTEGALAEGDFRDEAGRYQDLYTFAADSSGSVLSFAVLSQAFLPDLVVETPDGRRIEAEPLGISEADGRVTGVRSLQGPGTYRLLVTSREPNAAGAYRLRITQEQPVRTLAVGAAAFAADLGTFSVDVDGFWQDTYRFRAEAGRRHEVVVASRAFVPRLVLSTPAGSTLRAEATPSAEGLTLAFTPAETGTYQLVVTSEQAGSVGAYTVLARAEAPPPAPAPAPAGPALAPNGPPARDSLAAGQTREYRLNGRIGDRVVLDLRADGFAPSLVLVGPDGFRQAAAAEAERARLQVTLPSAGTYRVVVGGQADGAGAYALALEQQAAPEAAPLPRLPSREPPPPPDYQPQPLGAPPPPR